MGNIPKLAGMSWGALFSVVSMVVAAVFGYATLQSDVSANATNIEKHDDRIDEIEDRGHDANNRLIRIETHLERILQVLESQPFNRQ